MTASPFRWGILGTGRIAGIFADGLAGAPGHRVAAVGSRRRESAEAFAAKRPGARAHGDYRALADDPEVDAIYIASPHPQHREHALLCLERGKPVLCEKPLTVNRAEAETLVAAARRHGTFLMEAMWTRFLPAWVQVRRWLDEGAIGEPHLVSVDFGFRCGWDPASRLLDPRMAGGALLDVGIYTLAVASTVFGPQPTRIQAQAHLGATGVDERTVVTLGYAGGGLALCSSAVRTNTPHLARIEGSEGSITVPAFWRATTATLRRDRQTHTVELPFAANGYEYEALEVQRCLAAGLRESPVMPWAESLAIQGMMDEARRQIGLRYPFETAAGAAT